MICSWILCAQAASRSFADQIGDSRYWQELDWSTASSSAAWSDHNWVSYLGKQNNGETREKILDFRLDGSDWQATQSRLSASKQMPFMLTVYTQEENPQKDQCDVLYRWANKHFGAPLISTDGSYRLPASGNTPEHRTIDKHFQWDIGKTRITQECIAQQAAGTEPSPSDYAATSLRFSARDSTPALRPLISAKCSRTLRLNDSSDIPLKMSDITFVIDENNGSIRRSDLVPLRVRNPLVSGNEVRFSITLDKSNNEYQIERPGGQLSATMSVSGIRAGDVSGQCTLAPILTAQPPQ